MKIYISSVETVKSGIKNGRQWTMYRVLDGEGRRYTTFDAKYNGLIGQEVDVEVKEEVVQRDGKTYTNRTIIEPKKDGAGSGAILAELAAIKQLCIGISQKLNDLTIAEDSEVEPHEPEPENIPF